MVLYFFYPLKRGGAYPQFLGNENWPRNIPQVGKDAETGCIGCGWYNFEIWRNTLNQKLTEFK
ncbi:hypothetical protein [Okeania sp. SIO2B3]|uniref:hypothetical protein n=1 Tax=Okeania sp. SIO2B3 TaxID=2607784 RepID=UPI0013C0A651|nr:hypothetical protein [Okeania sp. SIO2B3]NET41468.1 hypothetical protein [Okeania sp. SIO2B3]